MLYQLRVRLELHLNLFHSHLDPINVVSYDPHRIQIQILDLFELLIYFLEIVRIYNERILPSDQLLFLPQNLNNCQSFLQLFIMEFLCFFVILIDCLDIIYLFVGSYFLPEKVDLFSFVQNPDGLVKIFPEVLHILVGFDIMFLGKRIFNQSLNLWLLDVLFLYFPLEYRLPVVLEHSRVQLENVPLSTPGYLQYLLDLLQSCEFVQGLPSFVEILL